MQPQHLNFIAGKYFCKVYEWCWIIMIIVIKEHLATEDLGTSLTSAYTYADRRELWNNIRE